MMTRNAKKIYGKPRKGGEAKGISQFKFHHKFEQILLQEEEDFLMEWRTRVSQHGMMVQKTLSHI